MFLEFKIKAGLDLFWYYLKRIYKISFETKRENSFRNKNPNPANPLGCISLQPIFSPLPLAEPATSFSSPAHHRGLFPGRRCTPFFSMLSSSLTMRA